MRLIKLPASIFLAKLENCITWKEAEKCERFDLQMTLHQKTFQINMKGRQQTTRFLHVCKEKLTEMRLIKQPANILFWPNLKIA